MAIPSILCIAGHDPTGGAGLQADIEAVAAQGGHALGLVTALTAQDTDNVQYVYPTPRESMQQQADCLLADCAVSAIKIGLIGSPDQLPLLAGWIRTLGVPAVIDPVLRAGGGAALLDDRQAGLLLDVLLPLATVLVPNAAEVRRLGGDTDAETAALRLLHRTGVPHLLVTGGDEPGSAVCNRWYRPGADPVVFEWPRIPGRFHGAGCTLASALAARIALGEPMAQALARAQDYTNRALASAIAPGRGRAIPARWAASRAG